MSGLVVGVVLEYRFIFILMQLFSFPRYMALMETAATRVSESEGNFSWATFLFCVLWWIFPYVTEYTKDLSSSQILLASTHN